MLSTAQQGPTMTIALLQNHTKPFTAYFDDIQPIFWEDRGRPHLGKKHALTVEQLAPMYPE